MPNLGVFAQGSPQRLYLPVRCVEASSLTNGYLAALAVGGNSFDGNGAVMADSDVAANLPGFCGVAAQDIASNAYGVVQQLGFAASVFLSNVGSSLTINQGDPLVPGKAAGGAFSLAPTYAASGFKFILASNVPAAISASGWLSGLVRCV